MLRDKARHQHTALCVTTCRATMCSRATLQVGRGAGVTRVRTTVVLAEKESPHFNGGYCVRHYGVNGVDAIQLELGVCIARPVCRLQQPQPGLALRDPPNPAFVTDLAAAIVAFVAEYYTPQ